MKPVPHFQRSQQGAMLIESLMAILIFSLGVLGLVGVNAVAVGGQSDAEYRSEANRLAGRIANEIWVSVDRSNPVNLGISLANFAHRADVADACDTSTAGTPSGNALVSSWVADVTGAGPGGLPGATDRMQQILIDPALNQVRVTLCWRAPTDIVARRHVFTSYIS
jgi:type IV pilus assembly protein PilV